VSDLSDIITEVRTAADSTSTRDTDAQITTYLNSSGRDLHNMIVQRNANGQYVRETSSISTVAGQEAYSLSGLSPGFLKAQRLWYIESASVDPVELLPIGNVRDFSRDPRYMSVSTSQLGSIRWMIRDFELHLHPLPSEVGYLRLDYTPAYSAWSTLPAYWPTPAWDFLVASATARILARDESDPSFWMAERERLRVACISELATVNTGRPAKVRRQNGMLL
jgi:hypothetical protein